MRTAGHNIGMCFYAPKAFFLNAAAAGPVTMLISLVQKLLQSNLRNPYCTAVLNFVGLARVLDYWGC